MAARPGASLGSHRFAVAIVGLLAGATLICVGILGTRMWYSHTAHYGFLFWNLTLAWVPFVFAGLAYTFSAPRRTLVWVLVVLAALL